MIHLLEPVSNREYVGGTIVCIGNRLRLVRLDINGPSGWSGPLKARPCFYYVVLLQVGAGTISAEIGQPHSQTVAV